MDAPPRGYPNPNPNPNPNPKPNLIPIPSPDPNPNPNPNPDPSPDPNPNPNPNCHPKPTPNQAAAAERSSGLQLRPDGAALRIRLSVMYSDAGFDVSRCGRYLALCELDPAVR